MASCSKEQKIDSSTDTTSSSPYRLPALQLESTDWKRLSADFTHHQVEMGERAQPRHASEPPTCDDAREKMLASFKGKQKDAESAMPATQTPSPPEQSSGTELVRFRPSHISQSYNDVHEYNIMSKGFYTGQPRPGVNYGTLRSNSREFQQQTDDLILSTHPPATNPRNPTRGASGNKQHDELIPTGNPSEQTRDVRQADNDPLALSKQSMPSDTEPTNMTEFHQQLCRSLSEHVLQTQNAGTAGSTGSDKSAVSSTNQIHTRKDSKWLDKPLPPEPKDVGPSDEPQNDLVSPGGGADEHISSSSKNVSRLSADSHSDQSRVTVIRQPPGRLASTSATDVNKDASSLNVTGEPKSRTAHPRIQSRPQSQSLESTRLAASSRPRKTDKQDSAVAGPSANPQKLVPYGTGHKPIDIFTYDARKAARPTMYRTTKSLPSQNTFAGKKFTEKGVRTTGALGVPPRLLLPHQREMAQSAANAQAANQVIAEVGEPSYVMANAYQGKEQSGLAEPAQKRASHITIEEPDAKPSNQLKGAAPVAQKQQPEKGFKKLLGRLTKKPSMIFKDNNAIGSTLTKHPSPFPGQEIQPKKASFLSRTLSRRGLRKSKPASQLHVHPALRAPEPSVARDRIALQDNDNAELGLIPTRDSLGRSWKDQNDESLRKWKESLGLGTGEDISNASDPRKVIIKSLGLEVEGRADIIIDLTPPGAVEGLKDKPFTIKEGAHFRMKATFQVQHQILSGLKYVQSVKRAGIGSKMQEMIGSYSPNTKEKPIYEKKFEPETAPSGMLARGHYNAVSRFIDDDNVTHLDFKWSFDIKKDW
ncbi:MAG: hypothetical protein M1822_006191 [Bathelium mastoideum]|nr:MAG: hypothetical protein M1822_006191 [Bathelium mastoideum]